MLKRLFRGAAVLMTVALCALTLVSCSSPSKPAEWNGSFYLQKKDKGSIVFTFETYEVGKEKLLIVKRTNIGPSGGRSTVGGGRGGSGNAEVKGGNAAESSDFRFTLNGDALTVKAKRGDLQEFDGGYKRGEPLKD